MHSNILLLAVAAAASNVFAAPTGTPTTKTLLPRASQCGAWDSVSTGPYHLYQNLWGTSAATSGYQCSQINGLSGNSLAWSTSWSWQGGKYNVKSYTDVGLQMTSKPLNQFKSIPTKWSWRYTYLRD